MIPIRVIPCLLLRGLGLVKTVRFQEPKYVGDPRNAVKIFNEKEVDELVLLDILATSEGKSPQFDLLQEIVSEAFMPIAYGGGIHNIEDASRILSLGVEKIIITTCAIEKPNFIRKMADIIGSQSIVVCLDVKRGLLGSYHLCTHGGRRATKLAPVQFATEMELMGAGELLVNSIDRDGTMSGYDIELLRSITSEVTIPVVACGGAGTIEHFCQAVNGGGVSAVAAGSMFVFTGKHRAVLISYPEPDVLRDAFR